MNTVSCNSASGFNAKWRKPRKIRATKEAPDAPPRARRLDRVALAVVIGVIAWASGSMRQRPAAKDAGEGNTAEHKAPATTP